jgi:hypothetical protein
VENCFCICKQQCRLLRAQIGKNYPRCNSVTGSSDPSAQSLLLSHFWAWGIHWSSSQVNIPSGQTGVVSIQFFNKIFLLLQVFQFLEPFVLMVQN